MENPGVRKKGRAFILILAIFFMALIELMAFAIATRAQQNLSGAAHFKNDHAAFLAADAGTQDTLAWLESELRKGREPCDSSHPTRQRTGKLNDCTWNVTIQPDDKTFPNGNHSCRCYTLSSQATSGTLTRTFRTIVCQEPFGKYARFVDKWPQAPGEEVYYWAGRVYVRGPVHSNQSLWIQAEPSFYNMAEKFHRLFFDGDVTYVDDVNYLSGPPSNAAQHRMLFGVDNQSQSPRKVKKVEFPTLDSLRTQAWGKRPRNLSPGFYANVDQGQFEGGIYIVGSVEEVRLSGDDRLSRQSYKVGGKSYVVEDDLKGHTSKVSFPNGTTVVGSNALNGVTYVEGDILSLQGHNAGNHTLAVNADLTDNIVVTGNITSQEPTHPLGLVTCNLTLPGAARLPRDFDHPLEIQAAIFAVGKGSQGGINVENRTTDGLGRVKITGCLVEGTRRRFAEVPTNTGWNFEVEHVPSLKTDPPPFFPALPKFTVKAYLDEQRAHVQNS